MRRKLCVVTGSRAEYGLMQPLIQELGKKTCNDVHLIITGTHLSDKYGSTQSEVDLDFVFKSYELEILDPVAKKVEIGSVIGTAVSKFSKIFFQISPDMVIILGDRYEIFAAAIAAYVNQIPISHLNGGEVTHGAYDEAFRHSITKLSYWHFVAAESYRQRVIQLGEDPSRVFLVGALGLDSLAKTNLFKKEEIESKLNFKFQDKSILVTYHPETLSPLFIQRDTQQLIDALDYFSETTIIITLPTADAGNETIKEMFTQFASCRTNVHVFDSLGHQMYISCMAIVDVVVGNSSSGIIEAPSLKKGTVNIGDRQSGRLKALSIIDCEPKKQEIIHAISKTYSHEFRETLTLIDNPYGEAGAVTRIMDILETFEVGVNLKKIFYDL